MAEVQFDEEQQYQQPMQTLGQKSFFVRLVLSTGIVSTDRAAEYVLLGIAISLIILAFVIPFFTSNSQSQVPKSAIDAAMSRTMQR